MNKRVLFFIFFINVYFFINSQELRIFTEELPPYNYLSNNEVVGLSTEVVKEILKELNINCDIKLLPWSRAYNMTLEDSKNKKGELYYTFLYSTTRTPEREKLFKWIGPIAPKVFSMFKLKDRTDIVATNLDECRKFRIGTVSEDILDQYLKLKKFENIITATDYEINFLNLLKNRLDLWPMPDLVASYIVKKNNMNYSNTLVKLFTIEELSKDGFYIACNKQIPDDYINLWIKALDKIKKSGVYQKILSKYEL